MVRSSVREGKVGLRKDSVKCSSSSSSKEGGEDEGVILPDVTDVENVTPDRMKRKVTLSWMPTDEMRGLDVEMKMALGENNGGMEEEDENASDEQQQQVLTEEERKKKYNNDAWQSSRKQRRWKRRREPRTIQEGCPRIGDDVPSSEIRGCCDFQNMGKLSTRTMWSYASIKRQFEGTVDALD